MSVSYLVDGYNLLFFLGLFERRKGQQALQQARVRLLDQLHDALANHDITVVFDSARNRGKASVKEQPYRGLRVRFAAGGEFADDVIETLIGQCAVPRNLVVISNDHRIQEAARRKGARAWSCEDYVEHAETGVPAPPVRQPEPPRRTQPSHEEVQHWLEEFGDLADDPGFREVFEPFRFEDDRSEPDA